MDSLLIATHTVLASVPGRFFFNRTKLKNRPSVQLETDRPGVEANTVLALCGRTIDCVVHELT